MATVGDTTTALTPTPCLSDVSERPDDAAECLDDVSLCPSAVPAAASLDRLPLELLIEVASWLDWRSLRSLERVSARCWDAVELHLGRLRVFRVTRAALGSTAPAGTELAALLSRLTALRHLYVQLVSGWMASAELLQALVDASPSWRRLERLELHWTTHGLEPELLRQICANCARLTDVTLARGAGDAAVEAVLAARPGLRALRVTGSFPGRFRGWLVLQLPAELLRLAFDCQGLRSAAVADLAHCGELRSLELLRAHAVRPEHLAAGLSGCPRLERLTLTGRDASVSDCLPPGGLPALRHLQLPDCHLTDADLRRLLDQLPHLESVSLSRCSGPTQHGLALLGRLPALSSLDLVGTDGVSDWTLASLCAAPLRELQLGDGGVAFSAAVSPEGLLALHQGCPTLRRLTLWADSELAEQVECGPGVDERRLLRWLRARVRKMVDLAMFGRMVPTRRRGWGGFLW